MRLATCLALTAALYAAPARANEDGRQTDRSMRGCGTASTCHGVNTGASARIEGPMNLMPGARGTYTLVITSTRSDFMNGGFNIAASGATLARTGTVGQLMSGELTHSAPIARSGAEVAAALTAMGLTVGYMTPQQLTAREQAYTQVWAKLIKASGFQAQ